jgi:carboxyl-terminal processing protease
MYREFSYLTILAFFCCAGTLSAGQDPTNNLDEPTAFASRILAVTDVVLQQHIDPPARQQMILSGVKTLYLADDRQVPRELSNRVSELATTTQLAEYLDGIHQEFSEMENAETILTQGMLSAVPGDSYLIQAKESEVNDQVLNNRYVGTGIALTTNKDEKLTQITKVFYNGPAWKAGIKPFDLILEIDGQSTNGKGLAEVVEALRGESGSGVEVVVRQPNSDESRRLTMTRGRVFIPSVEGFREQADGQWQYTIDSANDIALLRFKSIGPSTLHELRQIAGKLRQENVQGIVIDLRAGGGILHDIVMVADSLIDGGTIGHVRSLEQTINHEARPGDLFEGLPIVVLVRQHTSPGNVFLAAALQDNKRAIVVGEPTSGETYVSSFVPIPGRDDQLKLATGVMLRGDGTPLLPTRFSGMRIVENNETPQERRPGFVLPDRVVYLEPQPTTTDPLPDRILEKAVEILQVAATNASSLPKETAHGE